MALTPRLDLRQTQSLVMTPQLQQAIKLLQFSSIELQTYVEGQLLENPLLERDEAPELYGVSEQVDAADTPVEAENGGPVSLDKALREDSALPQDDLDTDFYGNVFDVSYADDGSEYGPASIDADPQRLRSGSFEEFNASVEDFLSTPQSLKDHLSEQVSLAFGDMGERLIARYLLELLDESGYLVGELEMVAEALACSQEAVEAVLARCQQLDPPGVFARSLKECLALQLADRGLLDPLMQGVLDRLDLVGRREWAQLGKAVGAPPEVVAAAVAEIRKLNPKPALAFDHTVAQPVIPDVIMRLQPNGRWAVELNPETLPKLLVNNTYYAQISRGARSREDRQYVQERMQSANWLIKSLHQRAITILKVAAEIIAQQQEFFVNGVQALRPLILRDVAEAISMHESTVSRVTSNKYIATPRGIFELKYFFTHAVGGGQGGATHTAEFVRHRLKILIDAEEPESVYSDDALAEVLQKEGIDIARRTVAKYREALGISSSMRRRREKSEAV